MSDGGSIFEVWSWIYAYKYSVGVIKNEFLNGAEIFMYQTENIPLTQETCKMFCLCRKCKNTKFSVVKRFGNI